MSQEHVAEHEAQREHLRGMHDALDLLEAHLGALNSPSKSEAMNLVLQLRQKIIERFSHVEHGAELENDAP